MICARNIYTHDKGYIFLLRTGKPAFLVIFAIPGMCTSHGPTIDGSEIASNPNVMQTSPQFACMRAGFSLKIRYDQSRVD